MRWDAQRYDGSFGFVSAYGTSVLEALAPEPGERILDLGCGTGGLAAEIARRGALVHGVDASAEMIAKARAEHPGLGFEVVDGHDLTVTEPYDAVFSNAALHWMSRDPGAVAGRVHAALRPGGRFVAEMGGSGVCKTIIDAALTATAERGRTAPPSPWYFPTPGEHVTLLESKGFVVREVHFFDRPTPLDGSAADWVRMFGPWLLDGLPPTDRDAILTRVDELTAPTLHQNGQWHADYVRLRFTAVRP